jgi:dihydrolipoamide dehydrogenase
MSDEYDVIVIGAGPVGENAAQYAVRGTDRTACLVERELVGGECSFFACIPSKALLRPVTVAAISADLRGVRPTTIDPEALLARRDYWVSNYDDSGAAGWAKSVGIDVVRGEGRVSGERQVSVGGRTLTARHAVVVATGSSPAIPDALAPVHPWTNRDATGVVEVPKRLAIIGGGVVACEAAVWLAALGSTVTMLVCRRLLDRVEPFAGELVLEGLRRQGVDVRLGVGVTAAERPGELNDDLGRPHGGPVRLHVDDQWEQFDEVLVAAGRRLNTAALPGDERPDWLYLVGDVSGEAALTHWGKYKARRLGARLRDEMLGVPVPSAPGHIPVPQVIFTDPEVAAVGPTLAQAQADDPSAYALDVPITSASGVNLLVDHAEGRARLVVAGDGRLLGATFVGPEVAELVHAATVAVVGRMALDQLWHAVPSFPTASEVWLRLLEASLG